MAGGSKVIVSDAIAQLGKPGRYTVVVFILLCFNYFPVGFNHLLMAVYGATPPHRCRIPDGHPVNMSIPILKDGTLDKCNVYKNYSARVEDVIMPCPEGWIYTLVDGDSTIVNEWDLVCERRYLVGVASSIYFAGVMLGGLVFGSLSDNLGRKPVMLVTLFSPILFGVMQYFVQSFILFTIIRFIIGFLMQGLQIATVVLLAEYFVRDRHRAYVNGVLESFWGMSVMTLAGVAYLFKDWRHIQLAITVPSAIAIFYICVIPESIRWLALNKKFKQAMRVMRRAANFNNVSIEADPFHRKDMSLHEEEEPTQSYTVFDLFRTPKLRLRSFLMFYIWLATSLGYYGLSLNASHLAGNKYLNFFISGAVEFPMYPAGILILSRLGRRRPLCAFFLIGGAACLGAGLIPKSTVDGKDISWLPTALAWIGKAATAGCFSVVFLYAAELYPTVIRNVGVGACAFWARVGSVIAPQINTLGDYTISWLPVVIFGAAALLGSVATFFLPETMNKKLPDTISEAEALNTSNADVENKKNNIVLNGKVHDITQL